MRPLLILAVSCVGLAQTTPKVEFEVVSIKPSPELNPQGYTVGCNGGPETKDPGRFRRTNLDFSNLITRAYGIQRFQLSGPDWLRDHRFEIDAKVPEGATKDDLNRMLQSMLADRFGLTIHRESRDMSKYDLVVAKGGPRLKTAVDAPLPDPAPFGIKADKDGYPILATGRPGMAMMNGHARLFYPKWTMEQLARQLGGQLGKAVTDATGLTGKYDIALYWVEDSGRPLADHDLRAASATTPEPDPGPPLEKAIQDQLGLRLEAKKGPVEVIVVDHLEKIPTEN